MNIPVSIIVAAGRRLLAGDSNTQVANRFGISRSTVAKIRSFLPAPSRRNLINRLAKLRVRLRRGEAHAAIARELGLSLKRVNDTRHRLGLQAPPLRGWPKGKRKSGNLGGWPKGLKRKGRRGKAVRSSKSL